jgi:hypothetical protein
MLAMKEYAAYVPSRPEVGFRGGLLCMSGFKLMVNWGGEGRDNRETKATEGEVDVKRATRSEVNHTWVRRIGTMST